MKTPLKQAVCEYLEEKTLDGDQLAALTAMQETSRGPAGVARRRRGRAVFGWSLAASAAIAVLAVLLWHPPASDRERQRTIAEEVVVNHLYMKPLEVESAEFGPVRDYFTALDFVPRESLLMSDSAADLTGGRYCTILGVAAAQLRLVDTAGGVQSLYEVAYDPEAHGDIPVLGDADAPLELYVRGMKVQMWVERGILFALTGE